MSHPEGDACDECAALDGREFCHEPREGQCAITDMTRQPLRPNRRCGKECAFEMRPPENGHPDFVKLRRGESLEQLASRNLAGLMPRAAVDLDDSARQAWARSPPGWPGAA